MNENDEREALVEDVSKAMADADPDTEWEDMGEVERGWYRRDARVAIDLITRRAPIEDAEVIVQDSFFKMSELPKVLDGYMTAVDEARREAKRWFMELESMKELMVEMKPAEDAEPVAYKVRDKKAGEVYAVLWHTPNYDPEQYDVTPLYRQPAKPIEVTDAMVLAAAQAFAAENAMCEWEDIGTTDKASWVSDARAAIEAALKEMKR